MNPLALPPMPSETIRPAWADPLYILATNDCLISTFTFASTNPVQVLAANPRRWAFGFVLPDSIGLTALAAPYPDITDAGWLLAHSSAPTWFTVFEFGPLVCRQWYGKASIGDVWRVIEIVVN